MPASSTLAAPRYQHNTRQELSSSAKDTANICTLFLTVHSHIYVNSDCPLSLPPIPSFPPLPPATCRGDPFPSFPYSTLASFPLTLIPSLPFPLFLPLPPFASIPPPSPFPLRHPPLNLNPGRGLESHMTHGNAPYFGK